MMHESTLRLRGHHGKPLTAHAVFLSVTAALLLLAPPGPARAQSPDELSAPAAPASGTPESPKHETSGTPGTLKSEQSAVWYAVMGTGAGIGLMYAGASLDVPVLSGVGAAFFLVGPSFGHFYAGETRTALIHSGVRVGAVAMAFGGLLWALHDCGFFSGPCEDNPLAMTVFFTGLLGGTGSAIYSFYDTPRAVRRHNAKVREFMLTPAPMAGPDRSTGFGLHLSGRF